MNSKVPSYDEAYVWAWLPGATEPVVAGRLHAHDGVVTFNYGRSYLRAGRSRAALPAGAAASGR